MGELINFSSLGKQEDRKHSEAVLHELVETEARTVGVIINEAPQQYGMFSEREITRPTGRGLIVDIDDILKGIDGDGE